MHKPLLVFLAFSAIGLSVNQAISVRVRPATEVSAGLNKSQQEKLEEVAGASLFGQFRSNMADFLWMKVEKYLHSGVDLRGVTREELERSDRASGVKSKDGERDGNRNHVSEKTVIPDRDTDWRGVLGDAERVVKPYMSMKDHAHREPKETLPLFRLMTWSNPKFVQGYATGAVMIAREERKFDEALAFIAEGEKNNPASVEIQETFAFLLMKRHYEGKVDYASARAHAERGLAIMAARDEKSLSDDERESWQNCVRWQILSLRDSGQKEKAVAAARAGLRRFPDDVTCHNMLREAGLKP